MPYWRLTQASDVRPSQHQMSESNQNSSQPENEQSTTVGNFLEPVLPPKNGQLPPLPSAESSSNPKRVNFDVDVDDEDIDNMDINQISKKYGKLMDGDNVFLSFFRPN